MKRQLMTVTPQSWSYRGSAVAYDNYGHPMDIWAGIVGERCQVDIQHFGQNRSSAFFVRPVGKPHRYRRKGQHRRFHLSGSCPLMHMTPEGQHQAKLSMIRESLSEGGLRKFAPTKMEASPDGENGYRHTVKLVYGRTDIGTLRLGAYARGTNQIVTIDDSEVVTPTLRKCMRSVAHHLIDADVWPYEPETGKGIMRHVVMRQSRKTGLVLVTLVASRREPRLRDIAQAIQHELAPVIGVQLHINDEPGNAIYARDENGEIRTRNLIGEPLIYDNVGSKTLGIGAGDFFQVNPSVADLMCNAVLNEFAQYKDRPVLDLYCGVGPFTMSLAAQHGWALGVEVVQGAIHRAKENARRNHVSAEFIAGDVSAVLPTILNRVAGKAPLIVVNPARKGLAPEVIQDVITCKPMRVAYISCNPMALTRDLVDFCEQGWKIDYIKGFDMMPQTSHSELIAMLSPVVSPKPSGRGPRRHIIR